MTVTLLMPQAAIDADKAGWLDARRPLITGSEIAAITGISAHASPFSLYHAKLTGDVLAADDRAELIRGRHLEPVAADMFTDARPGWVLAPAGLLARDGWMGATIDRIALDTDSVSAATVRAFAAGDLLAPGTIPVEIKSWATTEGWGDPPHGAMPPAVRAQALWNMTVHGAGRVLVVVLFVIPWRIAVYELSADSPAAASDIRFMIREARLFLRRLDTGDEPDVDSHTATTETLRRLHPDLADTVAVIPRALADSYDAARVAKSRAEARLRQVQNQIRRRAGDAATICARSRTRPGELVKVCSRSIGDYEVAAFSRHDDRLTPGRKWAAQRGHAA